MVTNLPPIIDVEASGFGQDSYPIEVGVVNATGERFCSLITPADHWTHWDTKAQAVHNISRQNLSQFGRPVAEVAMALNKRYAGQTLYSDGWVVDKPWLITLFHTANLPMTFSVSPLEMILSEEQMTNWHETKTRVETSLALTRHRASNDALIIQETFRRTGEFMIQSHSA